MNFIAEAARVLSALCVLVIFTTISCSKKEAEKKVAKPSEDSILKAEEEKFIEQIIDSIIKVEQQEEEEFIKGLKSMESTDRGAGRASSNCPADMFFVRGGTFTMGGMPRRDEVVDAKGSEGSLDYSGRFFKWEIPAHSVKVNDFCIARQQVSQKEWYEVMNTTLQKQHELAKSRMPLIGEGDNFPMYYVNWYEAVEYTHKLSRKTGKRYRLLTEAEWEYAARGGEHSKNTKYSGSNNLEAVAWYEGNSGRRVHESCLQVKNELGICDMSGNVSEWVGDWYADYDDKYEVNPKGPSEGSNRVLRGGGWLNFAYFCRVAFRGSSRPDVRYDYVGFRIAVDP